MSDTLPFCKIKLQYLLEMVTIMILMTTRCVWPSIWLWPMQIMKRVKVTLPSKPLVQPSANTLNR